MSIEAFVTLRLREQSVVHEVQQMLSALEMIAEVHRDADGFCNGCDRPWPCATIRAVAWTWRSHPDHDRERWQTETDYPQQYSPLTDAEKAFLIEAGAPADSFDPERMAEARAELAASIERSKYVLPISGPWGLPEVIEALPAMSHSELVALLNAPLVELNDHSPVEWLADDGAASVVIEVLSGKGPLAVAAARLWAEAGQLSQDRARMRLTGAEFEEAETELDRRILALVMARAEEIWPRAVAKDWMVASNEYLNGARPMDVLRERGPDEVLAALDAEEQGAIG